MHKVLKKMKAMIQYGDYYRQAPQVLSQLLNDYMKQGKTVVLWGAGLKGNCFLSILDPKAMYIQYVVDKNEKLHQTKTKTGHLIVSDNIFKTKKIDAVLVMNEIFYVDIFMYLQKINFEGSILDVDNIVKNKPATVSEVLTKNCNMQPEAEKLFGYTLRDIQMKALEILEEVDRVCSENNIPYVLEAGTALGVQRYKGFIPCDDDIDIAMLRVDYERFLKISPKYLKKGFFLQTVNLKSDYPYPYAQVVMDKTCFVRNNFAQMHMHHGIHIDIAPLDYVSQNKGERKQQFELVRKWTQRLRKRSIREVYESKNIIRKLIVNYEFYAWRLVPKSFLLGRLKHAFICYNIAESDIIGDLCTHYKKDISFRKEWIFPPSSAKFEGKQFPIPRCLHEYLNVIYDDYKELSPRENGTTKYNLAEVSLEHNYKEN